MKSILLSLSLFVFIGCGSKEASHLPSIFELPGAIIGGGIDNAIYNSKRKKVQAYAKAHYEVLKVQIKEGAGQELDHILSLAKVSKSNYPKAKKQLQASYQTIFHNTQSLTERIMMAFGKLYIPKEKTKKMNGFSYTEASNIVKNHIDAHFEVLRLDIKEGRAEQLTQIASKLHIDDVSKKSQFVHALDGQYDALYVDIIVVSIMISR